MSLPNPAEPYSAEPDPAASNPAASNPAASNPAASNPAASNPAASDPAASDPAEQVLDFAVWNSLTGPHARFAEGDDLVLRYPPEVSVFLAAAPGAGGAELWTAVEKLAGPGQTFGFAGEESAFDSIPEGWEVPFRGVGVQMIATPELETAPAPEAVVLGAGDVPEMLDLVERTRPGPFTPRTRELGTYLGIRREGALVAMAGERMHPTGFTEISAVCTLPEFRGQGLAGTLVKAVAQGIVDRGEVPFLHSAADNHNAIRLYQKLGFRVRRPIGFFAVRTPGAAAGAGLTEVAGADPETGIE